MISIFLLVVASIAILLFLAFKEAGGSLKDLETQVGDLSKELVKVILSPRGYVVS